MPKERERLNFANDPLYHLSLDKRQSKCLIRKTSFITKYDKTAAIFKRQYGKIATTCSCI